MKSRLFGSSRSLRAAALFALLPVIAASPAAASFSSCVAGLQEAAVRAGVSRSVASRALDIAQPDEKVLAPVGGAAGIQDADLGLSRLPRRRAARRRRPRHDAPIRPRSCGRQSGASASTAMSSRPSGASRPITGARRATTSCPMRSPRSSARAAGARISGAAS